MFYSSLFSVVVVVVVFFITIFSKLCRNTKEKKYFVTELDDPIHLTKFFGESLLFFFYLVSLLRFKLDQQQQENTKILKWALAHLRSKKINNNNIESKKPLPSGYFTFLSIDTNKRYFHSFQLITKLSWFCCFFFRWNI